MVVILLEKDVQSVENLTINEDGIVVVLEFNVLEYFKALNGKQESGGVLYGFKVNEKEEYLL